MKALHKNMLYVMLYMLFVICHEDLVPYFDHVLNSVVWVVLLFVID